ncbi:MAG: hypothetical protein JJ878_22280 [Alphaproteobacteria bacterium]|jgi:hypothetical protein|nr:hypothetical protein [Alphaproteobacteria bacterium]MBO6865365.1 hypothetical protein [Alphaproteobacteria bacterium]MEC9265792.1 hypothetical protein [Pseudomonadota bacterium]
MIVTGTEANTLLAAQTASVQRQPAQDSAAAQQRDRAAETQQVSRQGEAEAPQTRAAVAPVDGEESGRSAQSRQDLPQDAQGAARAAIERAGNTPPPRGSAVNLLA